MGRGPTQDPVRHRFAEYVRVNGTDAPDARVIRPQPDVSADGSTDCWTHAAAYAAAHPGAVYVEGICKAPRSDGLPGEAVHAHAWCEEDGPLGRVLVELTGGYERARHYRGVAVDLGSPQAARALGPDGIRFSVLELDIALTLQRGVYALPEKKGRRR